MARYKIRTIMYIDIKEQLKILNILGSIQEHKKKRASWKLVKHKKNSIILSSEN